MSACLIEELKIKVESKQAAVFMLESELIEKQKVTGERREKD